MMISLLSMTKPRLQNVLGSRGFSGRWFATDSSETSLTRPFPLNPSQLRSSGVLERSDRNSDRDKSEGGSTRYPVISVANGTCKAKAALSNLLTPAWPKAGRCVVNTDGDRQ